MHRLATLLLCGWAFGAAADPSVHAGMGDMGEMHEDDPLLWLVRAHEFELRDGRHGAELAWDAEAWLGHDLHKLWFKSEGAREDGEFHEPEMQLLYSRALAPFWDLQAGWRRDTGPGPDRDWAALGIYGLAPYFFETDAALFVSPSGRVSFRVEAEYELLLTQRLILTPKLELTLHSEDDPRRGIGSGFSEIESGLRLRYEFRRELAPYLGLSWERRLGESGRLARRGGEPVDDLQAVLGLRFWF